MSNGIRPYWISVPVAVGLALLFAIGVTLAVWLWLPLLLIFGRWKQAAEVIQAEDRLCGAALGWDGRKTISWECGGNAGLFCRTVCAVLDKLLQKRHCEVQRENGV